MQGSEHEEGCPYKEAPEEAIYEPSLAWPAGWGYLFHPKNVIDEEWIRRNLDKVAECGFLVYNSEETGILLGIDGAGYDFYEAYWLPLYRARGLKWHK